MTDDGAAPERPRPPGPGASTRRRDTHGRVWLLIAALSAVVGLVFAGLIPVLEPGTAEPPLNVPFWVLVVGFVLSERSMMWVRVGRAQAIALTLSDIPLTVGLFLAGPYTLLAARLVGTATGCLVRGRLSPHKDAFNLATHALAVGLALTTWYLVLGDAPMLGPRGWVAAIAAVLVSEAGTALCIFLAIWVDTGERDSGQLRLGWSEALAAGGACFGLTFVYVLSVDWRAGWLVMVVTLVLYVAHRSYAGLRRRTDDVESVSAFTGRLGQFLDVASVVDETLRTMTTDMRADIAELSVEGLDGAMVWRLDRTDSDRTTMLPLGESVIGRLDPPRDTPLVLPCNLVTVRSGPARRAGVRDAVAVPVLSEGMPVGTALVADRVDTVRSFGSSDVAQLQALANHAAIALHNARLAQDLRAALVQREHEATHDDLTGLPNRRAFAERLDQRRAAGESTVVAVIDLDNFHDVNDVLGPTTGDILLKLMAVRLEGRYGTSQVARLGAGEFAVLLDGPLDDQLDEVTSARQQVQRTITLGELDLSPEVSIGLAPLDPVGPAVTVLAHAGLAMRRAKGARSGVVAYDPVLDQASADRLTLLTDLRQAVSDVALRVHFQPQLRMDDGAVVGFEALVRWPHPRRGFIPPDEFIEVAEQGGLMMPLTLFVLDEALGRLAGWNRQRPVPGRDLCVSVNVSPRTLVDPELLAQTERLLAVHGVPASQLTIEITESDIMADPERAVTALQRLSDMGVRLSVDDLGTGYSSLAYLSRFPLDELKIDKSFILQLVDDPATEAVVDAIIGLGRRLGRAVVAEGVEDQDTWDRLRTLGCDIAQGFLMSRPMAPEDVEGWLETTFEGAEPRPTWVQRTKAMR